jgi:translation initiation factor IF-2
MCFNVSGKTGDGIPALLEGLALQTDVMELKAPDEGQAEAIVLDANLERGRGSVADILVRWGRLSVGDTVVVGTTFGKVKGMYDAEGKTLKTVGPSTPVRLFGLRDVPVAGQELISVSDETKAKLITDRRIRLDELKRLRQQEKHKKPPKDAELEEEIEVPKITEVSLILKADGVGTLSALKKVP